MKCQAVIIYIGLAEAMFSRRSVAADKAFHLILKIIRQEVGDECEESALSIVREQLEVTEHRDTIICSR